MGWKSMQRYLPQVAEVTRVLGDTLADEVEKRNPKLAHFARGGLKAIETFADEAGGDTTAWVPPTNSSYYQPYRQPEVPVPPPPPGQPDPALQEMMMEQLYREQLA